MFTRFISMNYTRQKSTVNWVISSETEILTNITHKFKWEERCIPWGRASIIMQPIAHSMLMFPILEICILVLSVNTLHSKNKYHLSPKLSMLWKGHNKCSKYNMWKKYIMNVTSNYNCNFRSLLWNSILKYCRTVSSGKTTYWKYGNVPGQGMVELAFGSICCRALVSKKL